MLNPSKIKDSKPVEKKLIERSLPVYLTDAQLLDISRQSAEMSRQYGQVEAEKKEAMQSFKLQMEEIEREVIRFQNIIRSGKEWRDIACEMHYYYNLGEVTVTRLDTNEIVETRPMNKEERQIAMRFEEEMQESHDPR